MTQDYYQIIHNKLLDAPKKDLNGFNPQNYLGTPSVYLSISTPNKKIIAREFKKNHPDISFDDLVNVLDRLIMSNIYEEKTIAPFILFLYKHHKRNIKPAHLDKWLDYLNGWAEVDSFCQRMFEADFFLNDWQTWEKTLKQFSRSNNISKRRASLVLLNKPLRETNDERLTMLALENVGRLKHEKDILITKAISWILREMVKLQPERVKKYIDKNIDSLPKIAIRETRRKLLTGKK